MKLKTQSGKVNKKEELMKAFRRKKYIYTQEQMEDALLGQKEELLQKELCLTPQENGATLAKLFGKGIMQLAEDAKKDLITHKKLLKSITSNPLNIKPLEQNLKILFLSVIDAIIGYIPRKIQEKNLLRIEIKSKFGWTEGISHTQRYKCLGNAVTVNVVREIIERLYKIL